MILNSDDPIGNCQAKHSNEQEKKKGRDGAGNPGPVYGQKDQAPDTRPQLRQTRNQTEKSQENRNKTTKQVNSIAQGQIDRRAEHQLKKSTKHRLNARKGGEQQRGSQGQKRATRPTNPHNTGERGRH